MEEVQGFKVGVDPVTGLDVYRCADDLHAGIIDRKIVVKYRQWCLGKNGSKVNPSEMTYNIVDIQAETRKGELVLTTPEEKDGDGTIITEAVYTRADDIIITPERLSYTKWRKYLLNEQVLGKTLEDIIVGSINYTLTKLPLDAPDGYCI